MSISHGKNTSNMKDLASIFSPNPYHKKLFNGVKEKELEINHLNDAQENTNKKLMEMTKII